MPSHQIPLKQLTTMVTGVGDNADTDDDADGYADDVDAFDNDVDAWTDTDGDGLADDFPEFICTQLDNHGLMHTV